MKTQNYANHRQSDRGWMIAFLLLVSIAIYGLYWLSFLVGFTNRCRSNCEQPGNSILQIIAAISPYIGSLIIGLIIVLKLRMYATKLQDRIIRQEVHFRYFVATGKTLPESLTISQIVALRFAGDDEFLGLVDQVINNPSLTNKEIKKMIKHRKGDYYRV